MPAFETLEALEKARNRFDRAVTAMDRVFYNGHYDLFGEDVACEIQAARKERDALEKLVNNGEE
jgi:hypothetical protein